MNKYIFLYKENNTNDRDCVKYIEIERIGKLECGHYFPHINLNGACFSMSLKIDEIDFGNISTILTKEEFIKLDNYNKFLDGLGYGVDIKPEKQEEHSKEFEKIKPILDKLKSNENEDLFERVKEEEKNAIEKEFDLTSEEIEEIFDNYYLDYQDRGIIGRVYSDYEELGEDESGFFDIPKYIADCIDYEKLGEKLTESDSYYVLESGKIVYLNY